MHTMNYATSAPAATAGGQQSGLVSVVNLALSRRGRLLAFPYPYL
jgi:hypothetical protein